MCYNADSHAVSDKISYSYEHITSYPMDLVVFQGSKSRIGINFSSDYLQDPSTPLNGSSSSVISGITTLFSFININQKQSSVKNSTHISLHVRSEERRVD